MQARTQQAHINSDVLTWARRESGFGLEDVAKKVGVKPERLLDWESGARLPTVRQAMKLASVFRRPLGVLFLPQPPTTPPLASEFRRLPGMTPGEESPMMRFALREMSVRREQAVELMEELGHPDSGPVPNISLSMPPEEAGEALRRSLGVELGTQFGWKDGWAAWRGWRTAVENAGVLVFLFAGAPLEEARGIALLHWPLPVAAANSKELIPEARAFTILHEFVHVALGASSDAASAELKKRTGPELEQVERFAEATTSAILMPAGAVNDSVDMIGGRPSLWDVTTVRKLARRFSSTPLAMATRLRSLDFMSWKEYHDWKLQWDSIVANLKPRGGGFATPVEKTLGRAGAPFTRFVLEAMDSNRITAAQASHMLALKFNHFEKLRIALQLRGPMGLASESRG